MIQQLWCKVLALAVLALAACDGPGVAPVERDLLAAACAIDPSGNMTLAVADGETAYLSRRVSDGKVVANATSGGAECTAPATAKITVNGDAGDNKVILDLGNGLFGAGVAGSPHLVIALGGETAGDSVKLRGTDGADHFSFGAAGGDLDGDMLPDLTLSGVEDLVVSAGPGDDVVSGAGGQGTGVPLPVTLTIYGGEGNDTLTGGAAADALYCGPGEDTAVKDATDALVEGCER